MRVRNSVFSWVMLVLVATVLTLLPIPLSAYAEELDNRLTGEDVVIQDGVCQDECPQNLMPVSEESESDELAASSEDELLNVEPDIHEDFELVALAGKSISTAQSISLDKRYYGSFASGNTEYFYQFTLPSAGRVDLNVDTGCYMYLYDDAGAELWRDVERINGSTSSVDLTKGVYYLAIVDGYSHGQYGFMVSLTSAEESFSEMQDGSNNSRSSANAINMGTLYRGQLAINDWQDYYTFNATNDKGIIIDFNSASSLDGGVNHVKLSVYDSSGNKIWGKTLERLTAADKIDETFYVGTRKGTYYISFEKYYNTSTGIYNFRLAGYIAPTWSGATSMPVNSTATYVVKNGSIKVKSGGSYVSVSGKTVKAKTSGTATLALCDTAGRECATKQIKVYKLSGKYEIQSAMNSDYVLDIQKKSKENSAKMLIYRRNDGNNQRYQFEAMSDGYYLIKCVHSGKYVDVQGGGTKKGQNVIQYTRNAKANQRWKITVDSSNRVTFISKNSGMAFDVKGGKAENGKNIIQYPSNGGKNQKWVLKKK